MIPEFTYAPYLWTSYALFGAVVVWQIAVPWLRRRRILAELREERAMRSGDYR